MKPTVTFRTGAQWGSGVAVIADALYLTNSLLFHPYSLGGFDMGTGGSFLVALLFSLPLSALAGAGMGAILVALLKTIRDDH